MRVVDEFMRQEGMQQRLHRRVGRGRVDEVGALQGNHVLVGQSVQCAGLEQRLQLDRRQALRLDDTHVPAAALDAQHVPLVADEIGRRRLARRVAAAMQDQPWLAAQQPRRVDAQRQVAADTLFCIVGNEFFGCVVVPQVLHVRFVRLLSLMVKQECRDALMTMRRRRKYVFS